jgi:hypothetical protein
VHGGPAGAGLLDLGAAAEPVGQDERVRRRVPDRGQQHPLGAGQGHVVVPGLEAGLVQGGQHVGGGRSVAPTRDAPVPEGGGDPPEAEEEKAAHGHRPPMEDRGNPLDLR